MGPPTEFGVDFGIYLLSVIGADIPILSAFRKARSS